MQPSGTTDQVVELVATCPARPLVIALDGPSAAGTTTLGTRLGLRLAASVVAGDDFYRDIPEVQRWSLTATHGVEEYFDWQRLRHEVLEPLRAGRPARYHPFSWLPGGCLDDRMVTVVPTPIIILEGVYTGRPQLRDLIDLAVLVENGGDELTLPIRSHMTTNTRVQFVLIYGIDPEAKAHGVAAVSVAAADGALPVGEDAGLPLQRFPLERTADAHAAVEAGVVGKVLIDVM